MGLGTRAIGNDFRGRASDEESVNAIHAGINLIDAAPAYGSGHSDKVVGRAIRGKRDRVVAATKVGILRSRTP